jgi:opacity protein-like surface antigen
MNGKKPHGALVMMAAACALGVQQAAADPPETGAAWKAGIGTRYTYVSNLDNDQTTNMGGLFVRLRSEYIGLEGAVDYRNESLPVNVDLKTWPVTASLMVMPISGVYGLAGLGWYHTTLDFPRTMPFEDRTDSKLGYHAGLGVELPVTSPIRVTSDVRWLFVDYEFEDIPDTIGNVDADSFTMSVGVALYAN